MYSDSYYSSAPMLSGSKRKHACNKYVTVRHVFKSK